MLRSITAIGVLLGTFQPTMAAEQIVTLGDSLTFAYEAEFGFRISIPFNGTYGDGMPATVRNWIETLNNPLYRHDWFDIGARRTFTVIDGFQTKRLLFRHEYNWAIPGATTSQIRDFVTGSRTFTEVIGDDADGEGFTIGDALLLTNLSDSDFSITDLEQQVRNEAERLTYFVGGNDVRGVYSDLYNNTLSPAQVEAFVAGFVDDSTTVIDQVLTWNPNLPIVIVAVPHIGITPDIRGTYPNSPIGTARVTTVLRDLNGRLKQLADSRGLGFADVFEPTLRLLDGAHPLTIHGIPFINDGSATGNLNYVWLNGEFSANFHPNTNAQAIIANIIIDAFNDTYGDEIPLLTATEILGGLLKKTPAEIDMTFASWMTGFGLSGLGEEDDSDQDGLAAVVEFGLGLDPTYPDADFVKTDTSGGSIALTYPIRLPSTTRVTVDAETAENLTSFTPITPRPSRGSDGYAHAELPITLDRGFLRLNCVLSP